MMVLMQAVDSTMKAMVVAFNSEGPLHFVPSIAMCFESGNLLRPPLTGEEVEQGKRKWRDHPQEWEKQSLRFTRVILAGDGKSSVV